MCIVVGTGSKGYVVWNRGRVTETRPEAEAWLPLQNAPLLYRTQTKEQQISTAWHRGGCEDILRFHTPEVAAGDGICRN